MTPHALPFPAPAAAAAAAAAAGGAAAEMRLEATPALLTTLCEERQMRQREIRQACAGRKSNIITFPMAAAAAAAASVNNATASASAGVGVGAEERAAHTLCRLLASVFVVPLCDWKSQSPASIVRGNNDHDAHAGQQSPNAAADAAPPADAVMDVLGALRLIGHQLHLHPLLLRHRFNSKRIQSAASDADADADAGAGVAAAAAAAAAVDDRATAQQASISPSTLDASMDSTSFATWLSPRLMCAAALLSVRFPGDAAAVKVRHAMLDLLLRMARLQCHNSPASHHARFCLLDCLKAAIDVFASARCAPFDAREPPDASLLLPPQDQAAGALQAAARPAAENGDEVLLRFFVQPMTDQCRPANALLTTLGDGIVRTWGPDDRSPFSRAIPRSAASDVGHALLSVTTQTITRLARAFPDLMTDLSFTATSLLLSASSSHQRDAEVFCTAVEPTRAVNVLVARLQAIQHALALRAVLPPTHTARLVALLSPHVVSLLLSPATLTIEENAREAASFAPLYALRECLRVLRRETMREDASVEMQQAVRQSLSDLTIRIASTLLSSDDQEEEEVDVGGASLNPQDKQVLDARAVRKLCLFDALVALLATSTQSSPLSATERRRLREQACANPHLAESNEDRPATLSLANLITDSDRHALDSLLTEHARAAQGKRGAHHQRTPPSFKKRALATGSAATACEGRAHGCRQATRDDVDELLPAGTSSSQGHPGGLARFGPSDWKRLAALKCLGAESLKRHQERLWCPRCQDDTSLPDSDITRDVSASDSDASFRVIGVALTTSAPSTYNAASALCALRSVIIHSDGTKLIEYADGSFDVWLMLVSRHLCDDQRSARIQAGKLAATLIGFFCKEMTSLDSLLKWVRHILGILIQAADTPADKPNASKAVESAILALGRAARVARDEVLHRILLSLVQHLNAPEPLRSLVYLQITELALHNNVTTYQLLSPAMGAISAHVVQRMFTAPTLLEELLALLNQQLGKFIHATLPHTLPLAIQKGNDRLLAGLAAAIKQSEREMCFEHAGAALKHFLLLPAPARDEAIQRFVIIIRGATDKATLENSTRLLLKSFKPQLLGHLVIHLGDEACRQAAIEGLSYLERSRSKSESTSASARDASAALSTFLRDDILEILAWLNDELAGAHGKTTLAQKIRTARSIGALVDAVGQSIASVTPQIMATLNSSMQLDELVLPTLLSWQAFITKMRFEDVAPFVGQTGASLVAAWPRFGAAEKEVAGSLLRYIVIDSGAEFASYLESDFPNLDTLEEELPDLSSAVRQRQRSAPGLRIGRVLERAASENASVSSQGLQELKRFLTRETDYVRTITSGNMFDPVVGRLVDVLFSAASKATEGQADVQDVCFESLGILGAVDPDRFELPSHEDTYIVLRNFEDRDESIDFCVHLIQRTLVGAFRASEDTRHQAALAYAIQELLKFCGFTPALLATSSSKPVALRVRQRWNEMSSETLEAVGPLLSSKYTAQMGEPTRRERPVYLNSSSFRDWIQTLANELILDAQGIEASSIFTILRSVIKDHDLSIARHILPHLVLHTLISGTEEQRQYIHAEICSILEDQVTPRTEMDSERRLLSAQVIFGLLDHISLWTRRRNETRKYAKPREAVPDNAVNHVSTVIGCISVELMARAALQCKAYARSLLNFERRVRDLKASGTKELDLQNYYEDMHFIYSNLEEPDGMEGISTSVLAPSLEHQIREHESLGRWTSAQSCWEVKLQAHPSEPDLHVGLLRCLRNLGHYDTMRTHIRGVLSAHPEWRSMLASYEVEGACILADWDAVRSALALETHQSDAHAMARIALAMHDQDPEAMHQAMREARRLVGRPIIAAGVGSYARAYDSVSQLHMIHELFLIQQQDEKNVLSTATATQRGQREQNQHAFSAHMLQRLNATLPSFRTREPLLSLRRSAFATRAIVDPVSSALIGQAWIQTAKNARHAGHDQTAYSAVLQATQRNVPLAFVQRAKLLALDDKKQTAVQELTSALAAVSDLSANATRTRSRSQQEDSVLGDPTDPSGPDRKSLARAHLLRARLIEETGRYSPNEVIESYKRIAEVESAYEKMWYCLGRYYDTNRDNLVNDLWCDYYVCRYYMKSAQSGTKYFYRTVPRMMTIWLDVGDDPVLIKAAGKQFTKSTDPEIYHKTDTFEKISSELRKASSRLQRYQILAVLPQLLSRVVHKHPSVWGTLSEIILAAVDVFPHQSLWAMMAGFQSKDPERKKRFMDLVKKLKSGVGARAKRISAIVEASQKMGKELLFLADAPVKSKETQLNLPLQFPKLQALADSGLILPLQSSVVVSLPGNGQIPTDYDPFGSPNGLPRLSGFDATIDIMPSLQKPRKVIMLGSDGKRYPFLCKPKDDLRKDARLMEFDSMINKLLQADSQARRRRLHIRTYSVITLNEECGLIEWVPNTIGLRHILQKNYARRDIPLYTHDLKVLLDEARNKPRKAADIFEKQVLSRYPSVFHEWFIATFPEPSAWLKARSAYAHTLAVMSMVGYVLGLGDRHGENILFDASNGDTVHVDLNCLFEKGLSFEIKEVVPFRLTHNMVDALGVTGVEGVFRRAAEISMRILRDNRDSLMSVLEAMIHDPLVEWAVDSAPKSKAGQDPRLAAARKALSPVQSKLDGLLRSHDRWTGPHSVNNAVDTLIRDATSSQLLASMYVGWASYL